MTTKAEANEAFVRSVQAWLGVGVDGHAGDQTAKAFREKTGTGAPAEEVSHHKYVGDAGVALIKEFEGERLTSYPDPATGGKPWTIGVGHTGPEVTPGMVISKARSDSFLRADLERFEEAVARLAPKTTQNQFDALVSFAFNLGEGNLASSTLLKKHNAGDYFGAEHEFIRWNRANGKVMAGLTRRREAEAALYAS